MTLEELARTLNYQLNMVEISTDKQRVEVANVSLNGSGNLVIKFRDDITVVRPHHGLNLKLTYDHGALVLNGIVLIWWLESTDIPYLFINRIKDTVADY